MIKTLLSKKQKDLIDDIIKDNVNKIYVEGSTQSGKTYAICLGCIKYANELKKRYPDEEFNGAIIGWSTDTLKGNIVDPLQKFLDDLGYTKTEGVHKGDYDLKFGMNGAYLQLFNIKYYFFGFNNVLSFNKILGRPLIFVWVDESARIYSQNQLQESFNELPGRQMAYSGHPLMKTIHSFNVEGSEKHPYKVDFLDNTDAKKYIFFPYDNPRIDTEDKIRKAIELFPVGSLREQKVYNRWVVAEGKVFNSLNIIHSLEGLKIREIGIGIDYGSVNPTTFVPIALCYDIRDLSWKLVRLRCYYHDPSIKGDTPTTEFFSNQLRTFLVYLKSLYPNVPITTIVIDSAAAHFANRLTTDGIPFENSDKGSASVNESVEHLQALIYKKFFYILEAPSITEFYTDLAYDLSVRDESLLEFNSYQYDKIKSLNVGQNCYKKELDHSIDATRYLITSWVDSGKCPMV